MLVLELGANLVIFDEELSPRQQRKRKRRSEKTSRCWIARL